MSAVFITATGTDIGKTFVTAGLIRHLRASGREVDALKPVMTGFDPAHPEASDAGVLLAALGRPIIAAEIARISPFRFSAPLSPDMAARRERRDIDFNALTEFSAGAAARAKGTLLIEGIGGVMVPLDDRHTVLDWMVALTCPVILVTGSYLGSLSHALDEHRRARTSLHRDQNRGGQRNAGLDGTSHRYGGDAHPLCGADPGRGAAAPARNGHHASGASRRSPGCSDA